MAQLLELASLGMETFTIGKGSMGCGEEMRSSCCSEPRRWYPHACTGFHAWHSIGGEVENEVGRGGGVRRRVSARVTLADDVSGLCF